MGRTSCVGWAIATVEVTVALETARLSDPNTGKGLISRDVQCVLLKTLNSRKQQHQCRQTSVQRKDFETIMILAQMGIEFDPGSSTLASRVQLQTLCGKHKPNNVKGTPRLSVGQAS